MAETCFHCGNPVPAHSTQRVQVDGVAQPVCCGGCEAAARLILAQGLERFYEFRTSANPAAAAGTRNWSIYDRDAALRRYTHRRDDGDREASLQIDGLHCAACAWLIESSLNRVAGVHEIHVNPASARAELRYDPARISFGDALARIYALGYLPQPLGYAGGTPAWTRERRSALLRLAVAGFGMMQVMTYAVALYAGAMDGIRPDLERFLRFVSLLVTTPVVLYSAQPFFAGAWRSLRARTLGMDVPVALSIGGAYLWSVVATLRGQDAVYFDSAVMFTFFLLLGRYLEMSLRHRSGRDHDALARLLPDSVLRIAGTQAERVLPDELSAGDVVRVLPGERVAADGEILSGRTDVDESLLTGEAAPRPRGHGDALIAGTLNLGGTVELRVTRVGADSTLAAVSRLLERGHRSRPRVADLADRVAAWFVGGVLLLALLVAAYWLHADATRAFPTVLAVLVVTCPCALSLATPAALAAATTQLARGGLLVTRGRAIERLARADRIVFDKTGTLTRGQPRVDEVRVLDAGCTRAAALAVAAALERHSEHPIARAFADVTAAPGARAVQTVPGSGVEGVVQGRRYRIGRAAWVLSGLSAATVADEPAPAGCTTVMLGDDERACALFLLADTLREDARPTLERLRTLGVEPQIVSGDRTPVVAATARRLGDIEARGDASASDKLEGVHALQGAGHVVAMVGDGVNDAPVLAGADISIAMGSGTDLAKVSADVVMLGEGLAPLASGIDTARRALGVVRQNLWWAVVYNATAVPLAAAGWLQPWMAAIGMSTSSLLVVLNAMRLLRARPQPAPMLAAAPAAHGQAARA